MTTRLCRSRTDALLGGVCGGFAQYLGIDPTLARLVAVLLLMANGLGVLLYALLWIILPLDGADESSRPVPRNGSDEIAERARDWGDELGHAINRASPRAAFLIGSALILMGLTTYLQRLDLAWLRWISFEHLWPVLFIAAGLALLWRRVAPGSEGV